MTVVEFNEKYKDYLEPRFYGLAIQDERVVEYLDRIFEIKISRDIEFKYYQIKLKMGYATVYTSLTREENQDLETNINKILNNKT